MQHYRFQSLADKYQAGAPLTLLADRHFQLPSPQRRNCFWKCCNPDRGMASQGLPAAAVVRACEPGLSSYGSSFEASAILSLLSHAPEALYAPALFSTLHLYEFCLGKWPRQQMTRSVRREDTSSEMRTEHSCKPCQVSLELE